ncbi:hypothetical protein IMSAG049_00953 [Clostridiales bacterium]|nr:hypothetical protein IMSAG049_00953 [Clostridiales bacterium]
MWNYMWPMCLIILSNVFYNLITKSTPADVNPYLSLCITYSVGAAISLLIYNVSAGTASISSDFHRANWTSYLLGLAIVGLEAGYIYLYRAGWEISRGSLTANISLAIILFIIGIVVYKDGFSTKQLAGMVLCVIGIFLLNSK